MAFTRINFNQIQGASETPDGKINIDKNINFTEQISIPLIPPSEDSDNVIWVEPSEGNFKNRINLVNYAPSFKSDFKNIFFSSPDTLSLGGNTGILNDLVISGDNTILNVRSSSIGTVQWSILEIKGDLTIASGCTLNLIRTPLIVRGNILGNGVITSPDGANGGTGGVGGPGGTGGLGAYFVNPTGSSVAGTVGGIAPTAWPNQNGGSAIPMPIEYGINSGSGGNGGIGTSGGGGGGGAYHRNVAPGYNRSAQRGLASGNGFAGGNAFVNDFVAGPFISAGGGGGGAGGAGTAGTINGAGTGGIGATGSSGTSGGSAGVLSSPYIGIGSPSDNSPGETGTLGGAGGPGVGALVYVTTYGQGFSGSPGGTGGNGGAGGGTGGTHLSIYCAGTVSSPITIRPGKGGLTGGSTSLPRAQTGSLWLFTLNNNPINTDITGATGTPNGPAGILTRTLISNTSGITDFFTNILFEPNGLTPEKTKFAVTNS